MAKPNNAKERPSQNSEMVSFFSLDLCFQGDRIVSFICSFCIVDELGVFTNNTQCYGQSRKFACAHRALVGVLVGCGRKTKMLPASEHAAYLEALWGSACF